MKYINLVFFLFLSILEIHSQNWYSPIDCLEGAHGYAHVLENEGKTRLIFDYAEKLAMVNFDAEGQLQDVKAVSVKNYLRPRISDNTMYVLTSKRNLEATEITIVQYDFDLNVLSTINLDRGGYIADFKVFEKHLFVIRYDKSQTQNLLEKYDMDGVRQGSTVLSNSGIIFSRLTMFSDGTMAIRSSASGKDLWYMNPDLSKIYLTKIEKGRMGPVVKKDGNLYVSGKLTDIDKYFFAIINSEGDITFKDTINLEHPTLIDMVVVEDNFYLLTQKWTESLNDHAIYKFQISDEGVSCTMLLNDFSNQYNSIEPLNIIYKSNGIHVGAGKLIDNTVIPSLFNMDTSCKAVDMITNVCESTDEDNDGYNSFVDCDDNNDAVNPGVDEIPYNGINDDCRSNTPDDDLDYDGYGIAEDCDDQNNQINPSATDNPGNGIDENCDGVDGIATIVHELNGVDVNIYPNPASHWINIKLDGNFDFEVELISINGNSILKAYNKDKINISQLPQGIYFVVVKDIASGESINEKVSINH